jgi:hypothetical protein
MGIIRPQSAVEVDESENETNLQMGFYQQCSATSRDEPLTLTGRQELYNNVNMFLGVERSPIFHP